MGLDQNTSCADLASQMAQSEHINHGDYNIVFMEAHLFDLKEIRGHFSQPLQMGRVSDLPIFKSFCVFALNRPWVWCRISQTWRS